jgi:hypothetical protein
VPRWLAVLLAVLVVLLIATLWVQHVTLHIH